MKKSLLCTLGFLLFWYSFSSYAIDMPLNVTTTDVGDAAISLDWDDVTWAIGYYVYYGTKTWSGSSYEVEGIELIDSSEYVIEELTADTKYFIAFTSVDTLWNESDFSNEVEETTLKKWEVSKTGTFWIKNVEVIDASTLQFAFSSDLDTSATSVRSFVITNKTTKKTIEVDISEVSNANKKQVLLILGEELLPSTQYDVTVLEIRDSEGNNIESGIDGFISFSTPVSFEKETVITENTNPAPTSSGNTNEETTETPLESAGEETTSTQEGNVLWGGILNQGNAGVTINQNDINSNISQAAENNEKLPQTGPAQWILLLIASMCIGFIFLANNKRGVKN